MSFFRPDHEIYRRRFSRNLGVGLALGGFVLLSFLLTVEKVTQGDPMRSIKGEGFAVTAEDQAAQDALKAVQEKAAADKSAKEGAAQDGAGQDATQATGNQGAGN